MENNIDEIENRVQRLREETSATAQNEGVGKDSAMLQKEIETRLAKLTDRDPNFYSSSEPPVKIFSLKSNKTDTELADLLLDQVMKELAIDRKREEHGNTVDVEIEKRLQKIRKANEKLQCIRKLQIKSVRPVIIDDDEDGEESMEETALDWCTTCNDDAVVRCLDCEDDVYCRECFR